MKRIEKVTRTFKGSQCICRRKIVETFKMNIIGPEAGTTNPSILNEYNHAARPYSTGIGCEKCGLQYGEPVFSSMLPNAQLEAELHHELSFFEYQLKRKITQDDLPEVIREQGLPEELKRVDHDDEIYVKFNESEFRTFKGYMTFYLSNTIGAKEYTASVECFK